MCKIVHYVAKGLLGEFNVRPRSTNEAFTGCGRQDKAVPLLGCVWADHRLAQLT